MALTPGRWDPEEAERLCQALAEHRTQRARLQGLGRRPLSPALQGLLWALRGYVLFMLVVVGIQLWHAVH